MNDIIYNDLMQSIPNTIFTKHYKGFLKYKDDMIQTAYLQIWKSKNKFNPNKGKLESFMATICFNTFNKLLFTSISFTLIYSKSVYFCTMKKPRF